MFLMGSGVPIFGPISLLFPNYTQINLFLDLNNIFFILSIKSWPRPLDEEWGASFFGTIYKLLSLFLTKEPTPD